MEQIDDSAAVMADQAAETAEQEVDRQDTIRFGGGVAQ